MDFVFAKNEKVINRYPFIKTVKTVTHKFKKEENTEEIVLNEQELVITDKRLIIAKRNGNVTTKVEKDINNISEVATSYSFDESSVESDKAKAKKLIIAGVISCILIIGIVLIFGIALIKKGLAMKKAPTLFNKKCEVKVIFYGVDESKELLDVGGRVERKDTNNVSAKNKKNYKPQVEEQASLKVQIDADVAKKLADSIGADLIEAKAK